jgi:hypothetical protein
MFFSRKTFWIAALLIGLADAALAAPLGSSFTYQGSVHDAGIPAQGSHDFEFRLFDAGIGGTQVGVKLEREDASLTAGIFSVELDYGASPFVGDARWLEISIRPGASAGAYTTLNPRQRVAPAPYALHAEFVPAGSITAVEIDPLSVQRRVTGFCVAGSTIRAISSTGAVTCQTDDAGAAQLAAHAAIADAHYPIVWNAPDASSATTSRDFVSINSSLQEATLYVNDAGATGPALLLANATGSEGDIAVALGDALQIGSWDLTADTYTNYLQIDSTGDVGIVERLGVGTLAPNHALVVQADDPVLEIRDDTTDNSANSARLELSERSGGSYNAGLFVRWDGALNRAYFGTTDGGSDSQVLVIDRGSQNVGIGTENLDNSAYKLAVNGTIRSKEIIVESGWADYVFEPGYQLASLAQVERHITEHGHLPDVPSAAAIAQGGVPLGQMQATLLRKIEELTLHLIAMDRELGELRDARAAASAGAAQ